MDDSSEEQSPIMELVETALEAAIRRNPDGYFRAIKEAVDYGPEGLFGLVWGCGLVLQEANFSPEVNGQRLWPEHSPEPSHRDWAMRILIANANRDITQAWTVFGTRLNDGYALAYGLEALMKIAGDAVREHLIKACR